MCGSLIFKATTSSKQIERLTPSWHKLEILLR